MKSISFVLSVFVIATLSGCISLVEEKVPPETPVTLHPAAERLKDALPAQLYVESQLTVSGSSYRAIRFRNFSAMCLRATAYPLNNASSKKV